MSCDQARARADRQLCTESQIKFAGGVTYSNRQCGILALIIVHIASLSVSSVHASADAIRRDGYDTEMDELCSEGLKLKEQLQELNKHKMSVLQTLIIQRLSPAIGASPLYDSSNKYHEQQQQQQKTSTPSSQSNSTYAHRHPQLPSTLKANSSSSSMQRSHINVFHDSFAYISTVIF